MNRRHSPPWERWQAMLFLVLAIGFWLWPFFWSGWKGRAYSFLPRGITHQYSAAGLFTKRAEIWWDHHIELEMLDGTRMEVDKRHLFPMGAFGYRTRLDRILNETSCHPINGDVRRQVARYIANRIAAGKVPGVRGGSVMKILLVRSIWRVGDPMLANPEGHWAPPPSPYLPAANRKEFGSWTYESARAGRPSALAPLKSEAFPQLPPDDRR